jgi:hypothetical protein
MAFIEGCEWEGCISPGVLGRRNIEGQARRQIEGYQSDNRLPRSRSCASSLGKVQAHGIQIIFLLIVTGAGRHSPKGINEMTNFLNAREIDSFQSETILCS